MDSYITDNIELSREFGINDDKLEDLSTLYESSSYDEFRISYLIKPIMDRFSPHKSLKNVVRSYMNMVLVTHYDFDKDVEIDPFGVYLLQQTYLVHKLCTKWLYEGEFVYDESSFIFYNSVIELIERDEDPFSLENRVKECLDDCILIESLFNTFEQEVC